MLVGFFTYKAAVVAKQSLVLLGELARPAGTTRTQSGTPEETPEPTGPLDTSQQTQLADEALSQTSDARRKEVERLFNSRMLSG